LASSETKIWPQTSFYGILKNIFVATDRCMPYPTNEKKKKKKSIQIFFIKIVSCRSQEVSRQVIRLEKIPPAQAGLDFCL
jgi:hypothetical protein